MKYKLRVNVSELEALQREAKLGESETARRLGISNEQLWKVKNGVSGVGVDFVAGCFALFPSADLRQLFFTDKFACVQAGGEKRNVG